MRDGRFEWDDRKAARNLAKHLVDFVDACLVFEDMHALDDIDDEVEHGEERFIRLGLAKGRVLAVVYAERGKRKRIISARRAERHEQDRYFLR